MRLGASGATVLSYAQISSSIEILRILLGEINSAAPALGGGTLNPPLTLRRRRMEYREQAYDLLGTSPAATGSGHFDPRLDLNSVLDPHGHV